MNKKDLQKLSERELLIEIYLKLDSILSKLDDVESAIISY